MVSAVAARLLASFRSISIILIAISSNPLAAQVIFRADPPVVTECAAANLGRVRFSWDTRGIAPVQVRVLSRDGSPVTGWDPSIGSAETGDWVSDGMLLFLVDDSGRELARLSIPVLCGKKPGGTLARADDSFFPLDVGNEWTFFEKSRLAVAGYVTWQVLREEIIDGVGYRLTSIAGRPRLFREGPGGKILERTTSGERVWLDPSGASPDPALAVVSRLGSLTSSIGTVSNVLQFRTNDGSLLLTNGYLAQGLGLVSQETQMISGSSGGFSSSLELVHARIRGVTVVSSPEVSLSLSLEKPEVRLVEGEITNCILPCYFVACGFVPPQEDPPGTFKPCMRARMTLHNTTTTADDIWINDVEAVDFIITGPGGIELFRLANQEPVAFYNRGLNSATRESHVWIQLPLYTSPNVPFPPGRYNVTGTIETRSGSPVSTSMPLIIR